MGSSRSTTFEIQALILRECVQVFNSSVNAGGLVLFDAGKVAILPIGPLWLGFLPSEFDR
jgi:hypothetical protein